MGDEINPDITKKTQDTLGKYIKRPPLTEKLLKKPPFRFLHDIITSVIRDTGFLQGVFTPEELNHENIKDRDGKMAFLQKAIDAVKTITGIQITARPSKIVAGHEPIKTNEFLQAIGKALDKKLSSKDYVEQLNKKDKTGKSKTAGKETKDKREKESSRVKSKSIPQSKLPPRDKSKSRDPTKKKSSSTLIDSGKHSKPSGDAVSEETIKQDEKATEKKRVDLSAGEKFEDKSAGEKPSHSDSVPKDILQEAGQQLPQETILPSSDETIKPITESPPKDNNKESVKEKAKESTQSPRSHASPQQEPKEAKEEVLEDKIPSPQPEAPSLKKPEKRKKSSRHKAANAESIKDETELSSLRKEMETPAEIGVFGSKTVNSERKTESPRMPPARPRTARPASARPAAPRIRDRGEVIVQEEVKPVVGKVNVITDNDTTKEQDEFDNFVVVEAPSATSLDQPEVSGTPAIPHTEEGHHGHLVAQILETKKELEDDSQFAVINQNQEVKRVEIEWEAGQKREKEMATKEVDRLRMSIQTLTRAANPLGKLMDFLQEDVDAMQRELDNWRTINSQLKLKLVEEQSLTEESVKPMRSHLQQLEQNIFDKLDEISTLKAAILRNDTKIQRLLTGGAVIPTDSTA